MPMRAQTKAVPLLQRPHRRAANSLCSKNFRNGTHTAVAACAYNQYKEATKDETKTVIASTASPFKFTRSVMNAIDGKYEAMEDFALVDELSKIANVKVPNAIEEIRTAPVLHKKECEVDEMPMVVKEFLGV